MGSAEAWMNQLAVEIRQSSGIPIYFQLEKQIRLLIRRGLLTPGQTLPTVRQLARDLGINIHTVSRVYRDLQHQGLLVLRRGVGTVVSSACRSHRLAPEDLRRIEDQVDAIIRACRAVGLTAPELEQLIELRWRGEGGGVG